MRAICRLQTEGVVTGQQIQRGFALPLPIMQVGRVLDNHFPRRDTRLIDHDMQMTVTWLDLTRRFQCQVFHCHLDGERCVKGRAVGQIDKGYLHRRSIRHRGCRFWCGGRFSRGCGGGWFGGGRGGRRFFRTATGAYAQDKNHYQRPRCPLRSESIEGCHSFSPTCES